MGDQRFGVNMEISNDLIGVIGNTPLIKLRRLSEETGCTMLGKAEFLNPGQSVKDRAALWIIRDAVARGALKPGGTIVEGTAGNTGIGLAMVGAAMGFRTVIVIPETQSQEKKDMMKVWNMVLAILAFWLCIFATFVTRGGVILSDLHGFSSSVLPITPAAIPPRPK